MACCVAHVVSVTLSAWALGCSRISTYVGMLQAGNHREGHGLLPAATVHGNPSLSASFHCDTVMKDIMWHTILCYMIQQQFHLCMATPASFHYVAVAYDTVNMVPYYVMLDSSSSTSSGKADATIIL